MYGQSGCSAARPAIAGIILARADWWLFIINVPMVLVALAMLLKWGPRTTPETRRFDWLDALTSAAMIGSLFYALSDLAHRVRSGRSAVAVVAVVAGCALASIAQPPPHGVCQGREKPSEGRRQGIAGIGAAYAPDRILLQELRDGTAFFYLRNVNSGHPGSITTVHANTAESAFEQPRR